MFRSVSGGCETVPDAVPVDSDACVSIGDTIDTPEGIIFQNRVAIHMGIGKSIATTEGIRLN